MHTVPLAIVDFYLPSGRKLDFLVYSNLHVLFESWRRIGLGLITSGPGFIAGLLLAVALLIDGVAIDLAR